MDIQNRLGDVCAVGTTLGNVGVPKTSGNAKPRMRKVGAVASVWWATLAEVYGWAYRKEVVTTVALGRLVAGFRRTICGETHRRGGLMIGHGYGS
jgi:hypothetical protein